MWKVLGGIGLVVLLAGQASEQWYAFVNASSSQSPPYTGNLGIAGPSGTTKVDVATMMDLGSAQTATGVKTLSGAVLNSPVLGGTATGNPTFSGNPSFTGTATFQTALGTIDTPTPVGNLYTPDELAGQYHQILLNHTTCSPSLGPAAIGIPSNIASAPEKAGWYEIDQDSTGGCKVTWANVFQQPGQAPPSISVSPNAINLIPYGIVSTSPAKIVTGPGVIGAGVFSGPIDAYGSALACYSLNACSNAFAQTGGPTVKLTRASDSTTLDINVLPNGSFDTTSAATFCASTTCTVKPYDQSGNGYTPSTYSGLLVFNCQGILPCVKGGAWNVTIPSTNITGFEAVAERTANFTTEEVLISTVASGSGNNLFFTTSANQVGLAAGSTLTATVADSILHVIVGTVTSGGTTSVLNIDGSDGTPGSTGTGTAKTTLYLLQDAAGANPGTDVQWTTLVVWGGATGNNMIQANRNALALQACNAWGLGTGC